MAIVVIPNQLQVYPELWKKAVRELVLDETLYDMEGPNRRLSAFCRENGIPLLDLLPVFKNEAETSLPLYFKRNPHWTQEGHRVAARALERFIDGRMEMIDTAE